MPSITIKTIINAPIAIVREKRNNPADIMQRTFASDDRHAPMSTNDLRIGWSFITTMATKDWSISFDFSWTYTNIIDHNFIEYIMDDWRKVSIIFESIDDQTSKITETFDPEDTNPEEMQEAWRQSILDNFKKYVENGQ